MVNLMRTIIAGCRYICYAPIIQIAIDHSGFNITEVVCGKAKGIDTLGECWAEDHDIPVRSFPANWNKFGKKAGFLRNIEMAKYADSLIAIWDRISPGTKHMIKIAHEYNLNVWIEYYDHN